MVKTIAMLTAAVNTAGRHTRKYTHFWYLEISVVDLLTFWYGSRSGFCFFGQKLKRCKKKKKNFIKVFLLITF